MKRSIFLWVAGGALLVAGAFFLPEQSGSIWPSVILSSIVALLYLIAFSFVWLKKIDSPSGRKAIGWTLAVLMLFSFISASISYEGSSRQTEILPAIRTSLETNLARINIEEPLLKTLRAYHLERKSGDEESIGSLFRAKYDSLVGEDGRFAYGAPGRNGMVTLYLSGVSPDSVTLIGESRYIDGKSAGFQNFSGDTGLYQTRGILTTKGVRYERTN